jgi:hypothetical protein
MCGRYGRRGDKQRIAEWMQTHNTDVFDESAENLLLLVNEPINTCDSRLVNRSHRT